MQEGAGHAVPQGYVEVVFDNSDGRFPVGPRFPASLLAHAPYALRGLPPFNLLSCACNTRLGMAMRTRLLLPSCIPRLTGTRCG